MSIANKALINIAILIIQPLSNYTFNVYFLGKIDTPSLLARWSPEYRDKLISDYGTNKEELVAFFGKTRDDLIAEDLQAWVGLNKVIIIFSRFIFFIVLLLHFSL